MNPILRSSCKCPIARPAPSLAALLLLLLSLTRFFTLPANGQGPLVNGEMAFGNLSTAGAVHTWTFSANTGESIAVRIGDVTGTNSLYPWVRLFGPNGVLLDQDLSPVAAEAFFRATNNGTFTVQVADGNAGQTGTGQYRLTLAKTGDPITVSTGDEGGPLVNATMHTGFISYGDLDVWSISALAGDSLLVRLGDFYGTNTFYPWVRLFGPNGVLLQQDFGPYAAETVFRATNNGTFTIVVGDANNGLFGSGPYRLTLAKTDAAIDVSSGDEGGPLTNGILHTGAIDLGDLDVWNFSATAGDSLLVRLGDLYGTNNFYPWVRLYGPNGALLHNDFGQYAAEATVRATNTGTFTVVVGDANNGFFGVGPYRLTLAKTGSPIAVSSGDEGGPLTNGLMHTGEIEFGDLDVWNFSATSGDNLLVRLGDLYGTNSFYPWVRLYGPNGLLLDGDFGQYAAEAAFRATNTGTFTVVIGDANNGLFGTGPYRVSLARTGSPIAISSDDEGGPLTNNVMHLGEISYGDLDTWSFNAVAGDSLIVRLGDLNGTNNFYPWVRLFGPNGVLLDQDFQQVAAEAAFRATNSGTFTVVVTDGNNGLFGIGPYRLTLAGTRSSIVVSSGDEGGFLDGMSRNGNLPPGDLDLYAFTACAGERIAVTVTEAVSGGTLFPWVRLYGRDGALLNSAFQAASAQIDRLAPASGDYLLVIGDGNNNLVGQGAYRLDAPGLVGGIGARFCNPVRLATNYTQTGIGGEPGTQFTVVTTTNVATPGPLWTPILTNQFGVFGEFGFTNLINLNQPEQYFRLRLP